MRVLKEGERGGLPDLLVDLTLSCMYREVGKRNGEGTKAETQGQKGAGNIAGGQGSSQAE